MYEKVTDKDIGFVAGMHDPAILKESLFPENIKAPHLWDEDDCKLFRLRNYQFSWQNYSHMLCDNRSLSKQENFKKKKLTGDCYNIGGRNTGKSYDFIQLDTILDIIHGAGKESCCGAGTQGFLNKVITPVLNLYRSHSFLKLYHLIGKKDGIVGGNQIEITSRHGHTMYGRSENIDKPEPGTKFHGLHYEVLRYEESHYMTSKGEEKRIDSGYSLGTINRFSGIPDIRLDSPLGKILSDENNQKFICRYPQYVREDWSESMREKRIEEYNGESSLAYKLNVLGEKIEGAEGFWDIERLKKKCLNKSRKIKQFDIDKKKYKNFKSSIHLSRLPSEQIFVAADIGAGARPTEIIIVFYNGKKYKLEYNITLNKLTSREQAEIFAYIYKELGSAFIGLDATTDYGIKDYLVKDHKIPEDHVMSVDLRKNIPVAFDKDENGRIIVKNGKELVRKERAIDWAMKRLEHLFYEGLMDIPVDNKFFKEFSGFKILQSGTRKTYDSLTTDDYHQSFQVLSIVQWDKEFETLRNNKSTRKNCLGIIK